MSYLTRVFLDSESAETHGIRDAYDWHQRIWDAFPHLDRHRNDRRAEGTPRFFLTRLDQDRRQRGFRLYILSATAPVRPAWCPGHEDNWATKRIDAQFLKHSRYRFSLRANPTKKATPKGPEGLHQGQGKRVPLREIEDLSGWLERKAEAGGFELEPGTLRITPRGLQHFSVEKQRRLGTLGVVDFDGCLRVRNRAAFNSAFANGIGSAKAFGFGLLLLQPLDERPNTQPVPKEDP